MRILAFAPDHDAAGRFAELARLRLADLPVRAPRRTTSAHRALRRHGRIDTDLTAGRTGSPPGAAARVPRRVFCCGGRVGRLRGSVGRRRSDGVLRLPDRTRGRRDTGAVMAGWSLVQDLRARRAEFREEFGVDVDARVGIHTGLVVVAEMGGGEWVQRNDVVGETPNVRHRGSRAWPNPARCSSVTPPSISSAGTSRSSRSVSSRSGGSTVRSGSTVSSDRPRRSYAVRGGAPTARPGWSAGARNSRCSNGASPTRPTEGMLVAITGEAGIGKTRPGPRTGQPPGRGVERSSSRAPNCRRWRRSPRSCGRSCALPRSRPGRTPPDAFERDPRGDGADGPPRRSAPRPVGGRSSGSRSRTISTSPTRLPSRRCATSPRSSSTGSLRTARTNRRSWWSTTPTGSTRRAWTCCWRCAGRCRTSPSSSPRVPTPLCVRSSRGRTS